MAQKYKVGDRVRIKSIDWYNENKDKDGRVTCGYLIFTEDMSKFCGYTMIVCYRTDLGVMIMGGSESYWTDEMIEGLVDEEIEKKLSYESWRYKNIFDNSQYPQSFELPDGYIFKDDRGNEIHATKIVLEKKTVEEKYNDVKIQILGNVVILKGGINTDNPTEYMNEVVDYILKLLGKPKYNQFIEDYLDNPWVRILVFDFNSMEFKNSFNDIVTNFKQQ